jgi:hypothetical protein
MVDMKKLLLIALPLSALAASPPPLSLNVEQKEQVRCVAVLAIAANDQLRGAPGWVGFPWLPVRGKRFAGIIGDRLVTETKMTREAIRDSIIGEVAGLQARAAASTNPQPEAQALVRSCIAMMDKVDPPKAPPTLVQCAAMMDLAAKDAGAADQSKQLANVAAILEGKARDELRAQGKTDNEGDIILGLEKETILAQSKANRAKGEEDDLNFESCFAQAAER